MAAQAELERGMRIFFVVVLHTYRYCGVCANDYITILREQKGVRVRVSYLSVNEGVTTLVVWT